jgi:hypothetical protein
MTPHRLTLTEHDALAAAGEALAFGGLQVPGAACPPLLSAVTLEVVVAGARHALTGRAVNPAPTGFFVQVDGGPALEALRAAVQAALTGQAAAAAPPGAPDEGWGDLLADWDEDDAPALAYGDDAEDDPDEGLDAAALADGDGAEDGLDEDLDADPRGDLSDPVAGEDEGAGGDGELRDRVLAGWQLIDPASEVPIRQQLQALTPGQKMRLAPHATRPVRRMLVRDVEKRLHLLVIKSPKVTDDELIEYSGLSGLSPQALAWMAQQPQLLRNRRILMNIVLNGTTPESTSLKLLSMLNRSELMMLTRSGRVREAVKQAAKRKIAKMG